MKECRAKKDNKWREVSKHFWRGNSKIKSMPKFSVTHAVPLRRLLSNPFFIFFFVYSACEYIERHGRHTCVYTCWICTQMLKKT